MRRNGSLLLALVLVGTSATSPARAAGRQATGAQATGKQATGKQAAGAQAAGQQAGAQQAGATERTLSEAVRREPDSFAAQRALAEHYLRHGKIAAALPHLTRAYAIDPADAANGYDLALAYLQTDKLPEARQQVQRLLSAGPATQAAATPAAGAGAELVAKPNAQSTANAGELQNLLGEIEARAGDRIAAAVAYQNAAHLAPTEDHLFDWGDNLLHLRAYDEAAQVFTAAIARHPSSARLQVGLGIAQYSRGQYDEAVRSFCRASDLAPADPRPHQFLGEMYGVSPDLAADVTKRLARFVEAQPRDALAHYYYALNLWKSQGTAAESPDRARVEASLRRAVALDPKLANAWLQLGILLVEQERHAEAIGDLKRAVALEPDLAQAHLRLARAYQRTGQPALAKQELAIFERLKAQERGPGVPAPPK